MKKFCYLLLMTFVSVGLSFCGSSENKTAEQQSSTKGSSGAKKVASAPQTKRPSTITKAEFEKRLQSFGVKIYENAKFDRIKKTNNGYQIIYIIPENSAEKVKQVHEYYAKQLDEIAKDRGLRPIKVGNLMMYRNTKGKIVISCANTLAAKSNKHLLMFEIGNDR